MGNIKSILLVINKNFRQWKRSVRIFLTFAILVIFQWYGFREYTVVSAYLGAAVSLCVFPFFVRMPIDAPSFGATALILYSEAPFIDRHTPFMVIRIGKRNWIIGQIVYLLLSSLIYTLVSVLLSFVVLLPNVELNFDWGRVIWTMVQNPNLLDELGVRDITWPDLDVVRAISGQKALLLSILFYWLVTVFLGMIMLFFNVISKKGVGLVLAGVFIGLSYFSASFGALVFGSAIKWFSPVCWRYIGNLGLNSNSNLPPVWYAFTILVVLILAMAVGSVVVFCKKDLPFEKGEFNY